jgi:hypothetical protein
MKVSSSHGQFKETNVEDEHLVARLEERITSMQRTIDAQREALREYVRMERYLRVEVAVFGVIGVLMTALLLWAFNRLLASA